MPLMTITVPDDCGYRAYWTYSTDKLVSAPARDKLRLDASEAGEFAHFIDYPAPCACEPAITVVVVFARRPGWFARLMAYWRHRPDRICCYH